jgi:hypothetical protein
VGPSPTHCTHVADMHGKGPYALCHGDSESDMKNILNYFQFGVRFFPYLETNRYMV